VNLHSTFLLVLGLAAIVPAQSPTVASTSPARNTRMGPYDPIRVTFASPISPATATAASVSVFGRWTGAVAGTIAVSPSGLDLTFQPLRPLLVGDCVTVSLARTITAPGGAALQDGYHFQAWVASAPGSGVFAPTQTFLFRQPSEGAISTYGVHAGDVDRDGVPDITAINEYSHDLRVFRSDGCGGYAPMQQVNDGLNWPSPHESADFNRDGWLDLVTGDYLFGNVSVFLNNGAGGYLPPLSLTGNTYIRSVGAADFDGDGYPDLVAGNGTRTLVWINNGNGGFLAPVPYSFQGSSELTSWVATCSRRTCGCCSATATAPSRRGPRPCRSAPSRSRVRRATSTATATPTWCSPARTPTRCAGTSATGSATSRSAAACRAGCS
jgi:hypothetical protein